MSEERPDSTAESTERLRLGIVGYERARRLYGPALRQLTNLEVAALMDEDLAQARALARELGRPQLFAEYPRFLTETTLDAVLIASPIRAHAEQTILAVGAGKGVLCHPTLALNLSECEAMLAAAGRAGTRLLSAFPLRFDPAFLRAAQAIEDRQVGTVLRVRCDWSLDPRGDNPESTAGWRRKFEVCAVHSIDLCRRWLGEVETVSADIDIHESTGKDGPRADLILSHSESVSVHHFSTTHRSVAHRFEIEGTEGRLEIGVDAGSDPLAFDSVAAILHRPGQPPQTLEDESADVDPSDARLTSGQRAVKRMLEQFIQQAQPGEPSDSSAADARKAVEILTAAYLSTIDNTKMSLPLTVSRDIDSILGRMPNRPSGGALEPGPEPG